MFHPYIIFYPLTLSTSKLRLVYTLQSGLRVRCGRGYVLPVAFIHTGDVGEPRSSLE